MFLVQAFVIYLETDTKNVVVSYFLSLRAPNTVSGTAGAPSGLVGEPSGTAGQSRQVSSKLGQSGPDTQEMTFFWDGPTAILRFRQKISGEECTLRLPT